MTFDNSPKFTMSILHWIVYLAFAISHTGGDRWDCGTCSIGPDGGPLNSPGAKALDTCAIGCIQAAPAGAQCENNPSSDCICNGAHYSLAIQAISSCAMASCNIAQDLAAATSVASTWCAQWSQTALPALVTPYTNISTTSTSLQMLSTTTYSQNGVPTASGKWLFNGCGIIAMMILSHRRWRGERRAEYIR
jgi:CFEM domain